MKGRHHIVVQSAHLKYELDICRNITIIKGDSATGKTTLVDMIREYVLNGSDTGITVSCEVPCRLIEGNTWKEQLSLITDSIVFIDEGNSFVSSRDFARAVRESSNYFVIITREDLYALPYSVTEIYGIHSSGKYNSLEPSYHSLYRIYGNDIEVDSFDTVIAEDSNSGYEFFSNVLDASVECLSAKGRDNIFNMLVKRQNDNVLVMADGAAFGAQMGKVYELIKNDSEIKLFLPESFEWLLLKSDILDDSEVREILQMPEQYIESAEYFSWEQYFTELLVSKSAGTYLQYSKSNLNPSYLKGKVKEKIMESIPFMKFDKIMR